MGKRLTREHYEALAKARGFEWLGPESPNNYTKTNWRCPRGHEWRTTFSVIRRGSGCPRCLHRIEDRDYHAAAAACGIEWVGKEAKNVKLKTQWRCKSGHEWETPYNTIRRGHGCPYCAGVVPKRAEDYRSIAELRGFSWEGPEVPTGDVKTNWRCQFGHGWAAPHTSIQQGTGCPRCSLLASESAGEREIAASLALLEIPYEREKRFRQCRGGGGKPLPFDFSFHYCNAAFLVEYDGRQHFQPIERYGGQEKLRIQQGHDAIKTKFAADNGYILIRIPYTVEQIETYLIQTVADAVGKPFGAVAFPTHAPQTANWRQMSVAPSVGIQIPLL